MRSDPGAPSERDRDLKLKFAIDEHGITALWFPPFLRAWMQRFAANERSHMITPDFRLHHAITIGIASANCNHIDIRIGTG